MKWRIFTFLLLVGCPTGSTPSTPDAGVDLASETGVETAYDRPAYFPELRIPDDNALTAEKITLGKFLFYDVRLSGNEEQACSDCHLQEFAFTDGVDLPLGSTGEIVPRNSSTLTNVGYNATLTWAHPNLITLESQLVIPIFGEFPVELGATNKQEEILARFDAVPEYVSMFDAAFPDREEPMTFETIVLALASFCRALISANSPYDRYTYFDEDDGFSESARRGSEVFFSENAECHHCHGGFNFTSSVDHAGLVFEQRPFHNNGLYNIGGTGDYPSNNTGLFEHTGILDDMGKFRAPTLRNIAVTDPYMHDGSIETLEEVVRMYERGGRLIEDGPNAGDGAQNPFKNGLVSGFTITDQEREDLIAFLEALTDESFLTDPRFADPFEDGDPFQN